MKKRGIFLTKYQHFCALTGIGHIRNQRAFAPTSQQLQPKRIDDAMTQSTENEKGFAGTALKGAVFLTGLRWVVRFIGLISISITARILTPEDFGIHSTAAIIVGLFTILQYSGTQQFLVKRETVTDSVINTSWTVRLGLTSIIGLCILAVSPLAPALLNEPRVFEVLLIYAFIPLIDALANPRIMLLLRNMEFGTLFKIRLIERLIAFSTLISGVLIFRSYWGIIIGSATSSIIFTIYTYFHWSYRPRLETEHIKEVGGFASVAMLRSISSYIAGISDSVAARQFMASDFFGGYHNSKDLARNLVGEVAGSISTALMPAMSKIRMDADRFASAACNAFGAIAIVAAALSAGLYLVASETVSILLGDQWDFAVPFVQVAAFIVTFNSFIHVLSNMYISLDRQNLLASFVVARAVCAVVTAIFMLQYKDPWMLLYGVLGVNCLIFLALMITLSFISSIGLGMVKTLIRPIISASFMAYGAPKAYDALGILDWALIPVTIAKVLIGALFFGISILAIWVVIGAPEGPEQALMDRTGLKWRRWFPRRS